MKRNSIETPVMTLKKWQKKWQYSVYPLRIFFFRHGGQTWLCSNTLHKCFEIGGAKKISVRITDYPLPESVKVYFERDYCCYGERLFWSTDQRRWDLMFPSMEEWLETHPAVKALIQSDSHRPVRLYMRVYIRD